VIEKHLINLRHTVQKDVFADQYTHACRRWSLAPKAEIIWRCFAGFQLSVTILFTLERSMD
jgi:hypothetical protein